jgi:Tol biopolymer transport system component
MYPQRRRMVRQTLGLGLLAALVVLALSACAGGGGQEANKKKSESGGSAATNGQIAFRRYLDPDQTKGALFTMNPDGSHIRQIAHPPEDWRDDDPVWSPDGTKVAFHRQRIDEMMSRIMVVNPETGDMREVTHCGPDQGWTEEHPPPSGHYCVADFYPAWAPEGNSISFRRILGPDKDCCRIEGIWIIGLDGSDPHQVTNVDPKLPEAFSDWGSAFSPDGKMLVFERVRVADERHAVFVQPIDSSGSAEDAQQITPWKLNCQDHPEFSPDGKLVLFRCLPKGEEGPSNLYWVHPDGTGLHQLTHAPADKQYLGSNFSPSFSAGEGWIAVGRTGGYGDEGNADVFRMRVEHGEVVREVNLTKSAIWDSNPYWGTHPPVD